MSVKLVEDKPIRVYESRRRSIAKALSWRVFATLITSAVVFVMTGEVEMAVSVGLLDTSIKLGAYFAHERAWLRISYGQRRYTDYQI